MTIFEQLPVFGTSSFHRLEPTVHQVDRRCQLSPVCARARVRYTRCHREVQAWS